MRKWRDHNADTWTINSDGSVDVSGYIRINEHNFRGSKLPFKFGKISGTFDVDYSTLETMENFPDEIENVFYCCHTKISLLEHFPKKVGHVCLYRNSKLFTESDIKKLCNSENITADNSNSTLGKI